MSRIVHSRGCQFRWVSATWVLTVATVSLYLAYRAGPASIAQGVEECLWLALIAFATSLAAVSVLARLSQLAPALIASTTAGFLVAYALGAYTYGTEGELQNGLNFRAIAGAVVGLISAVPAWSLQHLAHRRLSRDTCPSL